MHNESSGQFGSFDGLDNRKTILRCFQLMGRGLSEQQAREKRAGFLQGMAFLSGNGFAGKEWTVDPCSAAEAYGIFVAMCTALGVPIGKAAQVLENAVRKMGDGRTLRSMNQEGLGVLLQ